MIGYLENQKLDKDYPILRGIFESGLDGWKDDKEKFKLALINDIKTFLFTPWKKGWKPCLVFDEDGSLINGFKNINGRVYKHTDNVMMLKNKSEDNPYFITTSNLESKGGEMLDESKKAWITSFIPMWKDGAKGAGKKPDYWLPKLHEAINMQYTKGVKCPEWSKVHFKNHELTQYVESFITYLKKKKRIPKVYHDQADRCYYKLSEIDYSIDSIHMVNFNSFDKLEDYYSTLFHEIIHSTQNPNRCGRGKLSKANVLSYPEEELVAEMGAMILCEQLGLEYDRDNKLTYLKSWLNAAGKPEEADEKLLRAFSYASDAADYLTKGIDIEKLVPKTMAKRAKTPAEPKAKTPAEPKAKTPAEPKAKTPAEPKAKTPAEPKEAVNTNQFIERTNPEEVPYQTAYDAHRGLSFSPERRAKAYQKDFAFVMDSFAEQLEEISKTDLQKSIALDSFKTYKEKYLKKFIAYLNAKSRCLSPMITGPANFPVRSNQKKFETTDKRNQELIEYSDKAEKAILRKVKNERPEEDKNREAWEAIENRSVNTIASIVGISKGSQAGSISLFRSSLSNQIKGLFKNEQYEHMKKVLDIVRETQKRHDVVIFTPKNKIWDLENKASEPKPEKPQGELVLMENEKASLVNNFDAERVQIITEDKPSDEIRKALKKHSFRWSPRYSAWQRKNTRNSIWVAKEVFKELFPDDSPEPEKKIKTPAEPKAKTPAEPEQLTLLGHNSAKVTNLSQWKANTHIKPLTGDLGRFLGGYERNRFSMVLRGEKGAGKTNFLCQALDLFVGQNMKGLFNSLEVSPESELFGNYMKHIAPANRNRVDVTAEADINKLESYCKKYDVIAVDSWGKLANVAQDDFGRLVEKYPNVIWLVIFQSTTAGTARGGIMSEYDSSMVIQVVKGGNAECEKNRYNACDLIYNVFDKKLVNDENKQTK